MNTEPLDAPGLIAAATAAGAADIFLFAGYRPLATVDGSNVLLDIDPLSDSDIGRIADQLQELGPGHDYAGTSVRGPLNWDYPGYGLRLRLTSNPSATGTPATGHEA